MSTYYKSEEWDLSGVLPSDLPRKYRKIERLVENFEKRKQYLRKGIQKRSLLHSLSLLEKIVSDLSVVDAGVTMNFSANNTDDNASKLLSSVEQFQSQINNRTLFFKSWILGLSDKEFERITSGLGELEAYLRELRRFKQYAIKDDIEKTVNLKNVTGSSTLKKIHDLIVGDFKFPAIIDGTREEMTESQIASDLTHPDPKKRARVYEKLDSKYNAFAPILFESYKGIVRDWHNEYIEIRGYPSAISVQNFENEIPDDVVKTLLKVCKDNTYLFQEYFKMKSKICRIQDKMSITDVYAPVLDATNQKSTFNKGAKSVLKSIEEFSPEEYELALKLFDKHHIHSKIKHNKEIESYAFTMPPGFVPYLLINYTGERRVVLFLAHEIWHTIHDQLSIANHSVLTCSSTLALAETASTFGELQYSESQLRQAGNDKALKKEILTIQLDEIYHHVLKKAYMVMFEQEAHQMINSKNGATLEDISNLYYAGLKEQFNGVLTIPDYFKNEWMQYPSIFDTPFYSYSYVLGQLLSLYFHDKFKKDGRQFVPRFEKLLSYGGSAPPGVILNEMGMDISSEASLQKCFKPIEKRISALEKLI